MGIFTDPTPLIVWVPITFLGLYFLAISRRTKYEKSNLSRYIEVDSISSVPFGIPIIVRGKVDKIQNSLIGPASGKECTYYKLLVEEFVETKSSDRDKTTRWLETGKSNDSIPFMVQDETGRLEVNPNNAEIHPTHRFEKYSMRDINKDDPHLPADKSYLADIAFLDRPTGQIRLIEESVLIGDTINIFGIVQLQNGRKIIQETKDYAMFITDKSREQQNLIQSKTYWYSFLAGIALTFIGVLLTVVTILTVPWSSYIPTW